MKKRIIIEAEGNEKVDSKEKINGIIYKPFCIDRKSVV